VAVDATNVDGGDDLGIDETVVDATTVDARSELGIDVTEVDATTVDARGDLDACQAFRQPTPMPSPRRVSDAELLDAALEDFGDQGFEGTSVRGLCRRLGVSHNLVHERFGTKDDLWRDAVAHGFTALAVELVTVAAAAPDDPYDRLRAILIRYVELTAARPALIRIINYEAMHPGDRLDHLYSTYLRPAHQVADAALRLLEQQGRARRIPAATLHFLIGHGAGGLASLPALAGRFDPNDPDPVAQATAAVDLVLRGILTDPPARPHAPTPPP
jgi:AcrR family transcriptional regulator